MIAKKLIPSFCNEKLPGAAEASQSIPPIPIKVRVGDKRAPPMRSLVGARVHYSCQQTHRLNANGYPLFLAVRLFNKGKVSSIPQSHLAI